MKKRITELLAVLLILSQVPFYAVQAAEVATSSETQPALTDSTEPVSESLLPSINSEQGTSSTSEVATENSETSSTSTASNNNESAQPVARADRTVEAVTNEQTEQETTDPNLAVTNKLSVIETNTAVGYSQRFSQQIIVNGTTGTSWEDVHLTTKVKIPYKGWLNTDNFVLSDVQSIDGVTHSWHWEDETTLVIEYVAPKIYVGSNITIPYVLTTGSTAAENKKATVQSYISLGNSSEIKFESNRIELGAKINPWKIDNIDLNMELTEGDALLSTSYHRIYLDVPDTSIENGKVVGQKFNMKQILLKSIFLPALGYSRSFDPIYLGKVTFEIQIPEGINPVNPDSPYYNPATRTLSFNRQLDLSNLKSLNLDLLEFEEDIDGLAVGNYKIPFKVTAYNDLDNATYTLLDSNFKLYVKEITTSEVVGHVVTNSTSYDTYYVRNNELSFCTGSANLTNVELTDDWNWILSVADQDNSSNYVDNYISYFTWSMRSYEGTVNIYASNDGVNKEEVVAENLAYKTSSSYLRPKGQYKYIIIEPNADFKQHASLTMVDNFVRVWPKKTTTDPVYTDEVKQTMQTQFTSIFNLRGNEYARTVKANFLKPNNKVNLYVKASKDATQGTATQNNVTQDQTFTDQMYFNESYVDYYGENSKIIALIPSGVTLENIRYSQADAIDKNYQTVNNYQNTGKTALIFTHTPGITAGGSSPSIYFQFKASRYTDIGDLAIEYYYSFPDVYENYANGDLYKPIVTDTQDLNNNGSTEDKISKVTTNRTFNKTAEVLGVAEAKDVSDSEYTDTLVTSKIYADSGIIDYTIQLRNYLDIDLNGAEGIIRIPKVGANHLDGSGTLATTKNTYLASLTIPEGFTVEYTTDDLSNMTTENAGNYNWKSYNEDIDKKIITGIHFYNNSSYSLPSQQRQRFTYSVRIDNPKIGDKIDNQSIYMYRYGSAGGIFTTDVKSAEVISAKQTGTFKIQAAKSKKNLSGTIQLLDEHKQVVRTIDISNTAAGTKITDLPPGKYTVHQTGFTENYFGFDQEVEILESEKNNNHDITIINYPAVKSIELQDVTLYVGDEWNAAMNIKQILGMNNQSLTDGEYLLSSNSKVDTTKVGTYNVELSINQGEKLTAKVHVVYGIIVNPTDKNQLLVDDPKTTGTVTNTNMTLLKINYISDLEFENSTYRPNEGLTLKAAQDTSLGVVVNGEWQQKIMNPMINVEDRRTNQTGYKLTASMTSGFVSQYGRELDGAQLVFNQGASTYGAGTTTVSKLILGAGDNKELLSSNEKGSNSMNFNDVELVLPKGKSYTAGTYTAVVNWNLANGPV